MNIDQTGTNEFVHLVLSYILINTQRLLISICQHYINRCFSLFQSEKMFSSGSFFYLILVHFIIAQPQLNLYYTNWVSENENISLHDCLRLAVTNKFTPESENLFYCMSELPSKFFIENDSDFPNFTFATLSKQNITTQQLYLWSTPIDIIEQYQLYLTTNHSSLANQVFYNCTIPRFGSKCQYELTQYYSHHLSLFEIVRDRYRYINKSFKAWTCYVHLECNRGPFPACLDWTEVCNGHIDCLNDGIDEKDCWELEINECNENEHRCTIGQCIPKLFYGDGFEYS